MSTKGDLLRLARQLRGLTQNKASEKFGIPQAVLSRLENGLVEAGGEILIKASRAYALPVEFFRSKATVYGPPVSVHTMLRGKKSEVSARDVDMITAELNIRLFNLRQFLNNVDYRPISEVPVLDVESYESIEHIASIVRSHWKVSSGPVKNLTRLMERAGIIIGESNFNGAAVSGVTFCAPGSSPLVLVNKTHPADRIRFTLAHELGHLVMHRFPTAHMEFEANQFASAFLLPPTEMKLVFYGRKVTLELLAALKNEWRVSMQSLLMCAHSLGCITDSQNRYIWQQISARGWRLREPASLDFLFDKPSVLPAIIDAHTNELGFQFSEVVKMSRIYQKDFIEFYGNRDDISPMRPKLRVVV